jgi:hypothetical protein
VKITIRKSPTADTRTCDWSTVSKETLLKSSEQHIDDVYRALNIFHNLLVDAQLKHDHDKLSGIDQFHADFLTGFKQTGWWDNHRKVNRHHLANADGIPEDVNLVDVLEYLTDCVTAGMARSGSVYDITLPDAMLRRAFKNTVELLKNSIEVAP